MWTIANDDGNWVQLEFRLENNRFIIPSESNYNQDYIVNNSGILQVSEDDGYQYYKILSIEGSRISLCEGEDSSVVQSCTVASQFFFTNKLDSQTYFNNMWLLPLT